MWTHLERIAGAGGGTAAGSVGGIGTRGPGERQIEIDRRIVNDRLAALRRELESIDQRKIRQVRSRFDCFKVSLVGYTNSGKSTLLNALTDAGQHTADKLFATLDTKTVRWNLDDSKTVLLSDTVGFVRDLPHRLVASFRATLEEALHADLLLHVIDASNPEAVMQVRAVDAVLDELKCPDTMRLSLLNKMDAADDEAGVQILETRVPSPYRISAKTGAGIDLVVEAVRAAISTNTTQATLRLPIGDGRVAAAVDESAEVLDRRYNNDHLEVDVVIDRAHLDQLASRYPTLEIISSTHNPSERE
jgi:GTP-binding protein HflX